MSKHNTDKHKKAQNIKKKLKNSKNIKIHQNINHIHYKNHSE